MIFLDIHVMESQVISSITVLDHPKNICSVAERGMPPKFLPLPPSPSNSTCLLLSVSPCDAYTHADAAPAAAQGTRAPHNTPPRTLHTCAAVASRYSLAGLATTRRSSRRRRAFFLPGQRGQLCPGSSSSPSHAHLKASIFCGHP
jgi:hypothetical protein